MSKLVKVTVNGKTYDVEVGDLNTSPVEVMVNGKRYDVELSGGDAPVVSAAAPAAKPVSAPKPVAARAPATAQPVVSDENAIRAPMPGTILEVNVKPGDKVSAGQQVCTLEAMKMKNAIRSPREGVAAAVAVTEGQKVGYNEVLVTFA